MKTAVVQLNPTLGDLENTFQKIKNYYNKTDDTTDVVIFPECVFGYPLEDLTLHKPFMDDVHVYINKIVELTKSRNTAILFGTPTKSVDGYAPYNSAIVAQKGKIIGLTNKFELPNYDVFDEQRTFNRESSISGLITLNNGKKLGVLICEDLWHNNVPNFFKKNKPDLLVVVNGSPYESGKLQKRFDLVSNLVEMVKRPTLYVNLVGGQDEIVFDGNSFLAYKDDDKSLKIDKFGPAFEENMTFVDVSKPEFFNHTGSHLDRNNFNKDVSSLESDYKALVLAIRDYVNKTGIFKGVVVGNSGGIDSALTLAIAVDALGPERVKAIMLPYHYTSGDSLSLSNKLSENLGIEHHVVPIEPIINGLQTSLSVLPEFDFSGLTKENAQSQSRALVLMSYSRRYGYMVLTTGNKTEVSTGYCTLYGDMVGGMNALKDVYKTRVFELCVWRNRLKNNDGFFFGKVGEEVIPNGIITRKASAELAENQTDEDELIPFHRMDPILKSLLDEDNGVTKTVKNLEENVNDVTMLSNRIHNNEYKRRQAAHGVKITNKNFGRGRRWPIVNKWREK